MERYRVDTVVLVQKLGWLELGERAKYDLTFLGLKRDKMCCDTDNVGFGEDDDGVEDKDFESVTVNSWSFSVSEDTRVE
ncbi:hypothetical protein Tco_1295835 [Tanacetum coccineum]